MQTETRSTPDAADGSAIILAGDVGGTNTRLAFFQADGKRLKQVVLEVFPSRAHGNLGEIVEEFISHHRLTPAGACIGIAGPVKDGRSTTPNLPWVVDSREVAKLLNLKEVTLINDLEANGHGALELDAEDFVLINEGRAVHGGTMALIAAGTGLGEVGLLWDGNRYHPFPSEGGHCDLAPRNELEIELLRYLLKEHSHVSFERVLSGPGLYNIYRFLRDTGRGTEQPAIAEQMRGEDPPAIVMRGALERTCEMCEQALELCISFYGAEAGNLALKMMATGGVFIGGGIAPRIVEKLKGKTFMRAFAEKGRLTPLLEAIPVRVITNPQTALLGAAHVAFRGIASAAGP